MGDDILGLFPILDCFYTFLPIVRGRFDVLEVLGGGGEGFGLVDVDILFVTPVAMDLVCSSHGSLPGEIRMLPTVPAHTHTMHRNAFHGDPWGPVMGAASADISECSCFRSGIV